MTLTPNGRAYDFKGEMLVGALLGSVGLDLHLMWRARQGSNLQPLAPED
jgi:hypothetical protein